MKPALFLAVCLGFVLLGSEGAPRSAAAYDGLISGGGSSSSGGGGGYDGLLAPSQPETGSRAKEEPPGYEGLMRGSVPQRPATTTAPAANSNAATQAQQPARGNTAANPAAAARAATARPTQTARPELLMTPRPGRIKINPVSTVEQLRMLASLAGTQLNMDKMTADIVPSPAAIGLSDPKMPRIDGMLPMELMAKKQIDKVMAALKNPQLTDEQRRATARQGYGQLMFLADGVMSRRSVPDALYKKMGMGDGFLTQEKEGNERALARFEEAFKILRPLQ